MRELKDYFSRIKEKIRSKSFSKFSSANILDYFECEYAKALELEEGSMQIKMKELEHFLLQFLSDRYDKQVHLDILASMSFLTQSELTKRIKEKIRQMHFSHIQ